MLSKTCEYAIRASLYIAERSREGHRSGIKEITQGIDAPESFVAKILQTLRGEGFLSSIKGPGGGFYMEGDQYLHSVADIVRTIDGDKVFSSCILGLKQCNDQHQCPMHSNYKSLREALRLTMEQATISSLAEQMELFCLIQPQA